VQLNQSGVKTYEDFINYLDYSMATAILGQASSVNDDTGGSYARDEIKDKLRRDIAAFDIMCLQTFINDNIIKPLVDVNFNNVKEYPKWQINDDLKVNKKEFAETINILRTAGHNQIPLSYINEIVGIPEVIDNEPVLSSPQPTPPTNEFTENKDFAEKFFFQQKILKMQERYFEGLQSIGYREK
jgi:phage gp29-like protein